MPVNRNDQRAFFKDLDFKVAMLHPEGAQERNTFVSLFPCGAAAS
jgi:hypothetical protein